MTHSALREKLKAYERPYQRMELSPGDPGPVAVTKVGGIPWWPSAEERPVCVEGHPMAFIMQVRVDEVPGFDQPPTLLSFHYCDECTYAGKMPWGWRDKGHQRRYSVRLFSDLEALVDGLGVVAVSRTEPRIPILHDGVESLSQEDIWETFPETSRPGGLSGFETIHEYGSKLGGWPGWVQQPEYPEDDGGNEMHFVGQIDYRDSPDNSWSTGGVYLFVSEYDKDEEQEADMVIQTT